MPRLSNKQYLQRHLLLQQAWQRIPESFGYLSPHQQWDLHHFFQTTSEADNAQLLAERRHLTEEDPSLPNRAGKVFEQYVKIITSTRPVHTGTDGKHYAVGVVRPEIDLHKLARAPIELANEQLRQVREAA